MKPNWSWMQVYVGLKEIYDFRSLLSTFSASYSSICELIHFGYVINVEKDSL